MTSLQTAFLELSGSSHTFLDIFQFDIFFTKKLNFMETKQKVCPQEEYPQFSPLGLEVSTCRERRRFTKILTLAKPSHDTREPEARKEATPMGAWRDATGAAPWARTVWPAMSRVTASHARHSWQWGSNGTSFRSRRASSTVPGGCSRGGVCRQLEDVSSSGFRVRHDSFLCGVPPLGGRLQGLGSSQW